MNREAMLCAAEPCPLFERPAAPHSFGVSLLSGERSVCPNPVIRSYFQELTTPESRIIGNRVEVWVEIMFIIRTTLLSRADRTRRRAPGSLVHYQRRSPAYSGITSPCFLTR